MPGAHDYRKFSSTRIAPQIGFSVVAEYKRLLESPFEAIVRIAIFVVNNDKNASRERCLSL